MRTLQNPRWLLVVSTGPLVLLALLCGGEYGVIQSLLPPASLLRWQQCGLGWAVLAGFTLGYAGWSWATGRRLGARYAGAALVAGGAFLWLCTACGDELLPRSVPRWMVPTDVLVYAWTFVMPTLAHALLLLVVHATPADRPHRALPSFGLAAAVPLAAWLLGLLLSSLRFFDRWDGMLPGQDLLSGALLVAALALGPCAFLFFLVRGAYIIGLNRPDAALGIAWKVVVSLVLPVLGLAVNAGAFWGGLGHEAGIFGNFCSPWFYGLAVLNGALLCCPNPQRPGWRLALLAGRSALLGYTFYFFLVFLPFLPLSVLAVIAVGTGFLMLAPLVLLVLHVQVLSDDLEALRPRFARWVGRAALAGGAALLPLLVTASYWHDRQVLHAALAYVYRPDYARAYALNAPALARTLAVVRQHKAGTRDLFMGSQQPYLSAYYNWLVLDNLTLSDSKMAHLEAVFAQRTAAAEEGPGGSVFPRPGPAPAPAVLRRLTARSRYDARQQAWVSWVDLEVANADGGPVPGEYRTAFALPAGCWVGGYYLDINGRRESGLLAEQKAADWVYAQILHQQDRRDPGLLAYAGPGRLRLSVYPVVGAAVRRTGFQLLHKEPLALAIDGQTVALGTVAGAPAPAGPVATAGGAVVYLSAAAKQRLPLVQRQPYYHFLIDASAGKGGLKAAYEQRVADFLRSGTEGLRNGAPGLGPPRFTLVNTYAHPVPAGADWQQQLDAFPNAGGCYLTGAVQRVLADAQLHPGPGYPVLVVVTDAVAATVLAPDFDELAAAYPESDEFLVLSPGRRAETRSLHRALVPQPLGAAAAGARGVRAWPTAARPRAYLPDDGRPAVVLAQPQAALSLGPGPGPATRWLAGLWLSGYGQWQALHPAAADAQRLAFIQASFQNQLLTPLTSFLALENEAQKAALRRKQAQTLAANASLDAQETPLDAPTAVPLDDYAGWLLLLGLWAGYWKLRQKSLQRA
ncbi:MSEP-CTERM sorting domain-containing protein [Hymenobacter caeli]|uniref:VIT domain-containing protein n=1 Tax=Hymenobacter caeli TaxID=2735894 RepID=A0ABX2FM82_9BACT|nr:MSEP-CTERM sorting domain-containing protein [Hymenobacter caeli]NRT18268.1 hypothetical protein [Hymenobacter caeli]